MPRSVSLTYRRPADFATSGTAQVMFGSRSAVVIRRSFTMSVGGVVATVIVSDRSRHRGRNSRQNRCGVLRWHGDRIARRELGTRREFVVLVEPPSADLHVEVGGRVRDRRHHLAA